MYWQYGPHMLGDAHRDRMVGVEHERRRWRRGRACLAFAGGGNEPAPAGVRK